MTLTAIALNCTLKSGPATSSTELLLSQVLDELKKHDVTGKQIRIADHNVLPGVKSEAEGPNDGWPAIRQKSLMLIYLFWALRSGWASRAVSASVC